MGDTAHVLEHPSGDGIKVTILPLGATITSVRVPDKHGNRGECVLGFDREEPYLGKNPFFGSVAGRVANRTANAEFDLDGKRYELHANNGHHHLHGGKEGFNRKWWAVVESTATQLTLALRSPDGDEGYPGTLDVRVTYSLPTENTLKIDYAATTDKATPLNLTNHAYWNLEDGGASSVDKHVIRLDAEFYTPTDDDSIPTGEVRAVKGTPMDYCSAPRVVGQRLDECGPVHESNPTATPARWRGGVDSLVDFRAGATRATASTTTSFYRPVPPRRACGPSRRSGPKRAAA